MKSALTVIAAVGGLCVATLFLLGANPAAGTATAWEYGVLYVRSPNSIEWQDADRRVPATNAESFLRQVGAPSGADTDVPAVALQATLLNRLGQSGWELVTVTVDAGHDTYWFKRPR